MWRVSTVLSLSGLSTPYKFDEASRVRGTAVHAAAEAIAQGFTPEPGYDAFVQPLMTFFSEVAPEVVLLERRIVNRMYRLTGRIDMVAIVNGRPTIVDFKTGGKSAWHGLQLSAYRLLSYNDPIVKAAIAEAVGTEKFELDRAVLYPPGDGTYAWRKMTDANDDYLFKSALALVAWRYDHGMTSVVDSENPDDVSSLTV